jgi:hypothetical protein
MVGLLNAPPGTRLYQRLKKENRIVRDFNGSNTECNFIPRMNYKTLVDGYKNILGTIYAPRQYYERIKTFRKEYKPYGKRRFKINSSHIKVLWKTFWILGVGQKGSWYYWKLIISTLFKRPSFLPLAMKLSIYGYHFRKVAEKYMGTKIGASLGVRETEKSAG